MGQSDDIAELSGEVSIWFIPQHMVLWNITRDDYAQFSFPHTWALYFQDFLFAILKFWLYASRFSYSLSHRFTMQPDVFDSDDGDKEDCDFFIWVDENTTARHDI